MTEHTPPASTLASTDEASEAVRAPGTFRVTLDDLRARVADVRTILHDHLTVVILTMDNGWFLVGKSAPVDPDNCDAAHGRQLAYDDALRQAWALVAFAHLDAEQ